MNLPSYCEKPEVHSAGCLECALSSYRRDCRNNKIEPVIVRIASCSCGASDFDVVYATFSDGSERYVTGDWRYADDPIADWDCLVGLTAGEANTETSDWNLAGAVTIGSLVDWDEIDGSHDFKLDVFQAPATNKNL